MQTEGYRVSARQRKMIETQAERGHQGLPWRVCTGYAVVLD
jgi:hypothetical protein